MAVDQTLFRHRHSELEKRINSNLAKYHLPTKHAAKQISHPVGANAAIIRELENSFQPTWPHKQAQREQN